MKSRIIKLAAAAVIVMAILIGIHHFGGSTEVASVAWADAVNPVLNARTAILDILIGPQEKQTVIHDEVMGSRIRRTVSDVRHSDIIIDFEQQKLLTIDHTQKTAVYIELGGLDNMQNYIELLRNTIIRLQNNSDFKVVNQGLQEIEGQDYIVFVAESGNDAITIWANPETAIPVRIKQKTPNMQIVCDNLQFDVALDESRFSMEVPDGYTVQSAGIDFKKSSESDFIETLRIWAEIIEDGHFPDSINLEHIVKIGPKIDEAFKRANLTPQQQLEVATKWGQGLVFLRFFKGQGQWYYAGKGIKLGDVNTPIFWYQPQKSTTWRVIYGDLSVGDTNEMPQVPVGPQPVASDVWSFNTGGLAGWWKFDEGSGSTAVDSSGNGYNGTLNNMDDGDRVDGALYLDGKDSFVSIPPLNLNSNAVTISTWIKRDGEQKEAYTGIVYCRDGNTTAGLNLGGTGAPDWKINNELAYNWNQTQAAWDWHSGLIVPDNKWIFAALVVEPTRATLYMGEDGKLSSATNTIDHSIEEFDGVTRIGHDTHTEGRYFKGTIDDVRIYSYALSQAEVEAIFMRAR